VKYTYEVSNIYSFESTKSTFRRNFNRRDLLLACKIKFLPWSKASIFIIKLKIVTFTLKYVVLPHTESRLPFKEKFDNFKNKNVTFVPF